jgi:hypothetical protein
LPKFIASGYRLGRGATYLPLPKLNPPQMGLLKDRLAAAGFRPSGAGRLSATRGGERILISEKGLCKANFDPSDVLLPVVPDLLKFPKQGLPLSRLASMYYALGRSGGAVTIRADLRMETSTLWDGLRAAGRCALAPDEALVLRTLARACAGESQGVTDYASGRRTCVTLGGRRYYRGPVRALEFWQNLGSLDSRRTKSAFLPRDGTLRFPSFSAPAEADLLALFRGLGEWCYFVPT